MIFREDNYYEIITLFLNGYYFYCRQNFESDGRAKKCMEYESERSVAHEDIYSPNKSPVEQLILEVVYLVLAIRNGNKNFFSHAADTIKNILKNYHLSYFMEILPKDERLEFKADLWLCGLYENIDEKHEAEEIYSLIHKPLIRLSQRRRSYLSSIVENILNEVGVYGELRIWFLEHYYYYCRIKLFARTPWLREEREIYYAYAKLKNELNLPLEQLMLEVLLLILDAGRSPLAFQEKHREKIHLLLKKHDFMSLAIEKLPEIGALELASDLSSLGFWDYKEFSRKLEYYNS